MKRIEVILFFLLLLAPDIVGKERTNEEMRNVARSVLLGFDNVKTRSVSEPNLKTERVNELLGIYSAEGYGYVIVNRDDVGRSVLGYSQGTIDVNNLSDGLSWWLEATEEALSNGISQSYYSDILATGSTIDNFLPTKWNQNAPYNKKCPQVSANGSSYQRAPTGCVATAMAQVMNHYQYPVQGKGTGHYYVIDNGNKNEYVDDINGVYNFSSFSDTYSSTSTDEDISTLMFDAGRACSMTYAYNTSGATMRNCAKALAYNFSYDSLAVNYYNRFFYTDEQWLSMIASELTSRNPVIYGGVTSNKEGHAFLLTGLNADGLVWVNWGWGGLEDGWFAIDHLVCSKYDFSNNNEMLIGFRTDPMPSSDEENVSQLFYRLDYELSLTASGKDVYVEPFYFLNVAWRYFIGYVHIVLENEDSGEKWYYDIFPSAGSLPSNYYYGFTTRNNLRSFFNKEFPQGHYKVWLERKSTEESTWKPILRANDQTYYSWFSISDNGDVKVDNTASTTGVDGLTTSKYNELKRVYDLNGREVGSEKSNGSNVIIVKKKDGVEKKVVKKWY
ncbi:MAG: C10 family peptidase [Prevotella sp.]